MTTRNLGTTSSWAAHSTRIGQAVAAVIVAWIIFAVLGDLETNGLHLMVLGGLRIALLTVLLAFAARAGVSSRLGRAGAGLAATAAVLNLVGGVGAPLTDSLGYNPFLDTSSPEPPWYAYVIGASALLFAVGTVLVGIAGRSAGRLGAATILAGACYPLTFVLQALLGEATGAVVGHLVWIAPWLVLAVGLGRGEESTGTAAHPTGVEVTSRS